MKKRRRTFEENKKKPADGKAKSIEDMNPLRAVQEHENKLNLEWKLITLVSRGHCLVGAVFHLNRPDNSAEFDPYFIERIKNCLSLMLQKDLVRQLELEIN